jgi:hypothetical protein
LSFFLVRAAARSLPLPLSLPPRVVTVRSSQACAVPRPGPEHGSSGGAPDDGAGSTGLPDGGADSPPFPCAYKAPDGKHFDFSTMTTASGTAVEGQSSNEKYWINVCGAVSQSTRRTDRRAHAETDGRRNEGKRGERCGGVRRRRRVPAPACLARLTSICGGRHVSCLDCAAPPNGGVCLTTNATVCMQFS